MTKTSATEDSLPAASPALALAEHLRDGPLQRLIDLQMHAEDLATRIASEPGPHVEELAQLVKLSITAMEQFHFFTREFQALLRDLSDGAAPSGQ